MLTPFGKAVRCARINTATTLSQLATFLGVSVPFLSAVENGRKTIPQSWKGKVESFFLSHGLQVDFSKEIALSARQINLDSLPTQTATVLARLSTMNLDKVSEEKFQELIDVLDTIEEQTK